MKKLFLFISLAFAFGVNAQTLVVTTPSTTLQSYGTIFIQGADSAGSATTNQKIPSSYVTFYHKIGLSANLAITDTITLPASPIKGQSVVIYSNKAFYHKFKTSPAAVFGDTAGTQTSEIIYDGTRWQVVQ